MASIAGMVIPEEEIGVFQEEANMKTFYLTFGQKYPWRNGWVEVEAPDYETARRWVVEIFDQKWSNLLEEEKFDKSFYPAGKLGETIK